MRWYIFFVALTASVAGQCAVRADEAADRLASAYRVAGNNRPQIERAVREIEPEMRKGIVFLVTFRFESGDAGIEGDSSAAGGADGAVAELAQYLKRPSEQRPDLLEQPFAKAPLTKQQAEAARKLLWEDHRRTILATRADEMKARVLKNGKLEMPFWYRVFGKPEKHGRRLYISMHGGGGAPKAVNDRQWENQKRLYSPKEGVYVVPRAPTDTWNLWHQRHIDGFFQRLIEDLIVFEHVDPDRVYLMGYSAGGDGVYQLAPRMADRFAAASMMAGHPNETSPLGLRNLPFSLHVGGKDAAYHRNAIARQWQSKLKELRKADPGGYPHWAKIYEGKGHWLDREDAKAVEWMAQFTRKRFPDRVAWKQDDVTHARFYWLAVPPNQRKARSEIVARRNGQTFVIERCDVDRLDLLLHDAFVDLDKPIQVRLGKRVLFEGKVDRTIGTIYETLVDRGDPNMVFSARVVLTR